MFGKNLTLAQVNAIKAIGGVDRSFFEDLNVLMATIVAAGL